MDAVKFIEERNRMCKTSKYCSACSANRHGCIFNYPANNDAKEQVKVLEEWLKENPRKTRQSVFLEQYPNAKVNKDTGILVTYPCNVNRTMQESEQCKTISCADCRREFWLKEVE